ncbi:hypothetical protein BofuT4_uP011950.1 [Botrytis cinerea T4]|uniref:Uncharacterized protein n=1 Tax=Botryotinia fuckeliana (strain T4) TaxID=999810 RepID=G2XS82_BOTF4|nr:hypothetical protein BofuT4_uP011950.1 [Botrytis cinerea T4]
MPKQEALQPRHTTRGITSFILKRFPELCRHHIKESTIELGRGPLGCSLDEAK